MIGVNLVEKYPKKQLELVSKLSKSINPNIKILLISKGSIDASGKRDGDIFARAEAYFVKNGYEIWTLSRITSGNNRKLICNGEVSKLKIMENGLEHGGLVFVFILEVLPFHPMHHRLVHQIVEGFLHHQKVRLNQQFLVHFRQSMSTYSLCLLRLAINHHKK